MHAGGVAVLAVGSIRGEVGLSVEDGGGGGLSKTQHAIGMQHNPEQDKADNSYNVNNKPTMLPLLLMLHVMMYRHL
jgi:hypothetical protein